MFGKVAVDVAADFDIAVLRLDDNSVQLNAPLFDVPLFQHSPYFDIKTVKPMSTKEPSCTWAAGILPVPHVFITL
jgi:hypothetical protein